MHQPSESRQQGALATFIIVGIVLLSLTAGGLYLAKMRGNQTTANVGEQTAQTDTDNTPTETTNENTETTVNQDEAGQNPQQPEARPEPEQQPPAEPSQPQNVTEQVETAGQQRTASASTNVPATGPEVMMAGTIGVTALTYYGVRYLQSRRFTNGR